ETEKQGLGKSAPFSSLLALDRSDPDRRGGWLLASPSRLFGNRQQFGIARLAGRLLDEQMKPSVALRPDIQGRNGVCAGRFGDQPQLQRALAAGNRQILSRNHDPERRMPGGLKLGE